MQYLVFFLSVLIIPALLCIIDRRIKGCRSVVFKILSVITVTTFVFLMVYFQGRIVLTTYRVNLKSFTNLKAFFSSKMLVLLFLMIMTLFVVAKFVFIRKVLFHIFRTPERKLVKVIAPATLVFDLALIPNVIFFSDSFAIFAILTAIELGLVCGKLVFSISLKDKGVAIA